MLKRLGVSIFAAMFLFALGRTSAAQSNPFNGSWKEEPSTFQYTGPTYSMAVDGQGYTVTQDGKPQPKVVCDGKPQKRPDGEMLTCTKTSSGYALSATKDGKPVEKAQISLSADGKSATRKFEIHPPDGAPFTMTLISRRISGGPGLAGEWREVKFSSSQDNGILSININGGSVAFKETDSLKPITCKLDGSATKDGMGGSMSMRLADSHTLKVTYKDEKGKVRRENTFVLSADGKKITETDVTPAPSPSKMSVAFHKMT
jgi:hypothetical protein